MTFSAGTPSDSFRRVTRRMPCPICGNLQWCSFISDWGVHCMRVEDGSRKPANGGGWIHVLDGHEPDWRALPPAPPPASLRPVVSAEILDRAYQALLAHCPLSPADRDHLRQRGLSDEQIERHGYATLPDDPAARARIATAVLTELDQDPGGVVPGFIRQQTTSSLVGMAGIIVPFRDVDGRIIGLQVRVRNPREGAKYRWFSGGDGPGSVGQNGNTVHVARPAGTPRTVWIVITEGVIKANIVADHFGCLVLAVAGVANTGEIVSTIRQLGNVTKVVIAYDADADQNPHVAAAEARLACACAGAGFEVAQWDWPVADAKGIDDLLTSGNLLPFPIPHPSLASCPTRNAAPAPAPAPEDPVRLQELQKLHALSTQAHRSPNLGAERHVLTHLAQTLASVPEGEAVALPYPQLADIAGVSPSTVERSLDKVGIHPKEGKAGLFEGVATFDIRPVPERCNPQTGEITGGYDAMHVCRLAPVTNLLERIAQAPASEAGRRNGHGGKRCTTCGSTQVRQTITERCAECGELIRQITRTVTRGQEDPPPHHAAESTHAEPGTCGAAAPEETPQPHDAVEFTDAAVRAPGAVQVIPFPPPDAGGGRQHLAAPRDTLPGADHAAGPVARLHPPPHHAARPPDDERKAQAARSLAAWQDRHPIASSGSPPTGVTRPSARAAKPIPLPLFPHGAACAECGAEIALGQTWCIACDPRGM